MRASALFVAAILTVACGGERGTPTAPTPAPARIVVSLDSVTVTARLGGSDPDPVAVRIINGGEAQLDGLDVAVEHAATENHEWLVATLDHTSAPAVLRVEVRVEDLEEGPHGARIRISSSAADQDALVEVILEVQPPPFAELRFEGAQASDTTVRLRSHVPLDPFQIVNAGTAPASFVMTLVHSMDQDIDEEDRRVQAYAYILGPDEVAEVDLVGIANLSSRNYPLGKQYFAFVLDLDGEVDETDESNNVFLVPFTLEGWDLDVKIDGAGTVSASPEAGPMGYPSYTDVRVNAVPEEGWGFVHWITDEGEIYFSNPGLIDVHGPVEWTAVFRRAPSLAAQVNDNGRADLTWSYSWPCASGRSCPGDPGPDDHYQLQMDAGDGLGFQPLFMSPSTRESPYTHSLALEPGHYHFRVRARAGNGWTSPWSGAVELIYEGPQPPAAPSGLQVTIDPRPRSPLGFESRGADFYLSWQDNASNEDWYRVEVAFDDGDFRPRGMYSLGANTESYELWLVPGKREEQARFRVRAYNDAGASQPSEEVVVSWAGMDGSLSIINGSAYPVFSVRLDGREVLGPDEILAGAEVVDGALLTIDLAPGEYVVEATNGYRDARGWHALHSVVETAEVRPLRITTVWPRDPTAVELMTREGPSHTWRGSYVTGALQPQSVALTLQEDRSWSLSVDGRASATGDSFSTAGRDVQSYVVQIQLEPGPIGLLHEIDGYFELELEGGNPVKLYP
jgi:hypothetical protein